MFGRRVPRGALTAWGLIVTIGLPAGCGVSVLPEPASPSARADTGEPPPPLPPPPTTIVHRDITYESPGSTRNILDVHLPLAKVPEAVTILFIHGGGWLYGDKSDSAILIEGLAAAGFPVVSCNYTLSTTEAPAYPQAIHDVKAVVRWIRTTGAVEYRLPSKIVVVGESAGGHLALMLGTSAGVERFEPLGSEFRGGYRVDGVIAFFAPGDLVHQALNGFDLFATALFLGGLISDQMMPIYTEASPITYLDEADPPMALLHGEADIVVPFTASLLWRDALAGVCRSCRLFSVPDAGHGFDGFGGNEGAAGILKDLIPEILMGRAEPDLNGDGAIDLLDVERFAQMLVDPDSYFTTHPGCNRLQADQNDDGMVDGRDVSFMARRLLGG